MDGIALGTPRAEVEARWPHHQPANYWEDPNYTGWTAGEHEVFFGNHPEEADKRKAPLLQGVSYGNEGSHWLPLVGYDRTGRVTWVCGQELDGREGSNLLPWWNSESLARPGYCMAGPSGWRLPGGQVSVSGPGGERPGAQLWRILLIAPGPLSVHFADEAVTQAQSLDRLQQKTR